jgi:hypothetical protein
MVAILKEWDNISLFHKQNLLLKRLPFLDVASHREGEAALLGGKKQKPKNKDFPLYKMSLSSLFSGEKEKKKAV